MRILANENVPADAVDLLRSHGHDVSWVRAVAPAATDETVLALALGEGRLLITFDKDFGELVFAKGLAASHGVVLFRIGMPSPAATAARVLAVLGSRTDWSGHFSVVDDSKIRMVPLPKAGVP